MSQYNASQQSPSTEFASLRHALLNVTLYPHPSQQRKNCRIRALGKPLALNKASVNQCWQESLGLLLLVDYSYSRVQIIIGRNAVCAVQDVEMLAIFNLIR